VSRLEKSFTYVVTSFAPIGIPRLPTSFTSNIIPALTAPRLAIAGLPATPWVAKDAAVTWHSQALRLRFDGSRDYPFREIGVKITATSGNGKCMQRGSHNVPACISLEHNPWNTARNVVESTRSSPILPSIHHHRLLRPFSIQLSAIPLSSTALDRHSPIVHLCYFRTLHPHLRVASTIPCLLMSSPARTRLSIEWFLFLSECS